jgi:tetratricopeptide (TPR) repeat protein
LNTRLPLLLFLLLVCTHAAVAEDMSAEKMLSFADYLFEKEDYYRAITEYERMVFYFPEHPLAKTARFQIAQSYFKGEKLDQASARFQALANNYSDEEIGRKSLFMLGETYYQKHDFMVAKDVFTQLIDKYPDDTRVDTARIRIGWSYLRQGNWRQASEEFQKLPSDSPLHSQAEGLANEAKNYPDIPKKSPVLAGSLSAVLPGSGQLYIDRPGDALVAFLLNGAFILATVEAFHHDNNVTGGILLFFETGWYLGNIYNAVNGANKYNRRSEQQFLNTLQNKYVISYYNDGHGLSVLGFTTQY